MLPLSVVIRGEWMLPMVVYDRNLCLLLPEIKAIATIAFGVSPGLLIPAEIAVAMRVRMLTGGNELARGCSGSELSVAPCL